MTAYYNEIEPHAVEWLQRLILAGELPDGDVDGRSIVDVDPEDLAGYTQCHFFAGIGGWPLAARWAGWPDDRPLWTGSCPCQPLSSAGLHLGHADERHLWPTFHRLIAECQPPVVFGEQVANTVGREWLSGVRADLEASGYACGTAIIPACGVGAPHRRDRQWFVADAEWNQQPRQEPRRRQDRRMGREQQLPSWDGGWRAALTGLRVVDDGVPRCVEGTDAARNAIVPHVAAEFIGAYLEHRRAA